MLSVRPAHVWQRAVMLLSCFSFVSLILLLGGQPFGPNFSAAQQKNPSQTTRASRPTRAQGSVYLSDLTPNFQANGRGPVERDQSNGGIQVLDGSALAIKGVAYRKGLGVSAYSELRYDLGGQYAALRADIGVADEAGEAGSVVFRVMVDGVKVFESAVLRGGMAAQPVSINVAGKKELVLMVRDGGDGDENDSAIWADARLELSPGGVLPIAHTPSASQGELAPTHTHAPGTPGTMDENHAVYDAMLAEKARNYPGFVTPKDLVYAKTQQQLSQLGLWSGITTWPFVFASVSNLPDGRLLAWGGNNTNFFNGGFNTYAAIWNPANNQITSINHNDHSMFCAIPTMLEDGRIFVNGGDGTRERVSIFDWRTNLWTRAEDMERGRWYPGSVALPNGKVFTALGEPGDVYPEIWTPGQGWTVLNGANLQAPILNFTGYNHNWLPYFHLAPNGNIFHSGPTQQMNWINPSGSGSIANAGINNAWYPKYAAAVMYDKGKILVTGGQLGGNNFTVTNQAQVIDLNSANATRTQVASMAYARKFHNAVVLPTGEVLVVGGTTVGVEFDDSGTVLAPEIWNPATGVWRTVADISVPRNYHSVATLLTDGRVWSGGGGLCGCDSDHPDHQVFTPPYLYTSSGTLAARPTITTAPAQVVAGQTINVQATASLAKFSLIKMAGLTHNMNSDLRYLSVPFTAPSSGQYQLTLDSNRNVLTPGYWMLFALNSAGVPSVAKVIQVVTALGPVVTTPVVQNSTLNTSVNLQVRASSPMGSALTYSANGLPPNTSINSQTGVITGTVTQTGSFRPTVTVSDGSASAQVSFDWFVRRPNLAQGKTATQSSTYEDASASLAVDGNTNGNYGAGSVTHTNSTNSPWWQVDLGATYTIDSLQLWNRSDCCQSRLANFYVFVSTTNQSGRNLNTILNDSSVWRFYRSATSPSVLEIPAGINGRYVRVQLAGSQYLSLAEVRAFGALPQANRPPVLGTLSNRVNSVGNTINATLTATDPDGDALTFTATGLPPGVSLSSAGVLSGTTTTAGTSTVNVAVSDGRGGTATGSFTWTVNAQLALNALTSTPKPVNTNISYTASAINAINPRYKWLFGDGTAETAYSTSASVTKSFAQPGLYVVRCTATDDRGIEVVTTFVQAVHLASTANRPVVSMNIVLEDRASANDRLWVVNQDNNTVSVFDAVTNAKAAEINVGTAPRSLAIAPNGRVWVTNKGAATISIIDPATLAVVQTLNLQYAAQPFGIAFAPNGGAAWVALEAAGKLIRLDAVSGAVTGTMNTGPNVRHLSITGDGGRVYLSRFISPRVPGEETVTPQVANGGGEVLVINTSTLAVAQTIRLQHSNEPDAENSGRGIPNYLGPAVISPDGVNAWTPSKQDNLLRGNLRDGRNLTFDSTVRSITSRINLTTGAEDYPARLDHNNGGIASTGLFDRTGNYLFIALEGSREVAVLDSYGKREIFRVNVGRAPQGLALSADGQRLFVSNFMDRTVSVLNLTEVLSGGAYNVPVLATLNAVATERLTAQVLNGKRLFYDARDTRLAQDAYMSCASCHNDGGHDGRVWDLTGFGEGLRNTIALQGRAAAHGFSHWSGNFDEIQDFEGQIRNLAGGTGLMTDAQFNTGTRSQPLGDRKTGISADLDALAAYVASLSAFSQSPYRTNGALTADATAGRQIFQTANCAQCHSGTAFSEAANGTLRNIGTLKPASGTRLGAPLTGIDTPTLRDVWATAPYLHDGSAATLEAAVSAHNGVTIAGADLPKLVAYLQQIGSEEASAPTANQAPTVSLTAPANNATFTAPATINFAANATDGDGIARVEFYQDATKLGEDTSSPYAFSWTNVAAGSYSLTVRAFDNLGASANSTVVNVTVNSPANQPPTVSLTAPANNATFTAPATISLAANAGDGDGTVARVEFYQGTTKLGEDTSAPYAFAWTNVAAGTYSLTARAFDNAGASGNSAAVNVTVTATGGGGVQNIIWTNLVNTTVSGTVLRKTGANSDGSWNGRAVSQQEIASGDGYVEFTATGPNVYRAVGLNGAGALNTPDSLDYAVVFTNSNLVEFRQGGAYRGDATFAVNDVFRVAVESGVVNFYKNGVKLASGSTTPVYPLNAGAVFSYLNGEISNAKLSSAGGGSTCSYSVVPISLSLATAGGTANVNVTTQAGCTWTATSNATWLTVTAGASGTGNGTVTVAATVNTGGQRNALLTVAGQNVAVTQAGVTPTGNNIVWTELVNTSVIGNILRKTSGANDGSWDGSAASQQTLASGAGWLEFTATGPQVYHAVGLNAQGALAKEASIDFAVVFTNANIVEFRESGAYRGDTTFVTGDIFRVAIEGARVNFYKNGVLLAQSAGAPAYPIRAAAVFANTGGELSNAKLTPGTVAATGANEAPWPWLERSKQWLNSLVAILLQ
jgi:large repetitive protein